MRSLRPVIRPFRPRPVWPRTNGRLGVANHQASPGTAIVALPTEIDIANAHEVYLLLSAALTPGINIVVADLSRTIFCDVRGVRALIKAQNDAAAAGAELRLAVPPGRVRKLLAMISLDGELRIFPGIGPATARPGGPASLSATDGAH
jgi:anti-anti-sigma factor